MTPEEAKSAWDDGKVVHFRRIGEKDWIVFTKDAKPLWLPEFEYYDAGEPPEPPEPPVTPEENEIMERAIAGFRALSDAMALYGFTIHSDGYDGEIGVTFWAKPDARDSRTSAAYLAVYANGCRQRLDTELSYRCRQIVMDDMAIQS